MIYVEVYIEHNAMRLNQTFTYVCSFPVEIGCRVKVPFGKQVLIGYVENITSTCDIENVREVLKVLDTEPLLNAELMALADWMSKTYVCSKISCLKTMLPPALKPSSSQKPVVYEQWAYRKESDAPLTAHQEQVLSSLSFPLKASMFRKEAKSVAKKLIEKGYVEIVQREKTDSVQLEAYADESVSLTKEQEQAIQTVLHGSQQIFLLHGVTGSGKTEVFLQLAQNVLEKGKQVLFLVPEIGLTPQMIKRVTARFGRSIAIYHSQLNQQEKYEQYQLVKERKVNIVVGTRSAVFMPFHDLGIILMDEEHDNSYKQDNTPKYHTRDIVAFRARHHQCKVVLASATPSLYSYSRAYKNRYQLVNLTQRVHANLPQIHLVDMKKEASVYGFSKTLMNAVNHALEQKQQVIFLLNRRGFLPVMRCMDCNTVMTCPDCGTSLAYHKKENHLECHCCGRIFLHTNTCPTCHSHRFYQTSMGTEKLEEQLTELFPLARIIRMDADTTRKKRAHQKLLETFEREGDILVGTQMVAKGLDFPRVSVVGIINADASLSHLDYCSNEIAYQLLEQASGRSGRADIKGDVYIQTFDPEQFVLQCVKNHNYLGFFTQEMKYRYMGNYPPYCFLCTIIYSHKDINKAKGAALEAKDFLKELIVLGPVSISMRQKRQRVRLVVKSKSTEMLTKKVWELAMYQRGKHPGVTQDINMYPIVLED
ncbi:MAG: primosomal protein N' [Erysipelotrichaceae bacterium]|nr:primosomal protein N' [Erysipelotrichaceae bacterium]